MAVRVQAASGSGPDSEFGGETRIGEKRRSMRGTASEKLSAFLERRSGWIVVGVALGTLLLIIPLMALAPDEQASTEPGGPVFDLRDLVDERFPPALYVSSYILESPDGPDGDVLTQAALWELYQNEEALRRADERGELRPPKLEAQPYLFKGNNPNTQLPVHGMYSIADAVQAVLADMGTNLERASDEDVKIALHFVLQEGRPTFGLRESISEKASFTLEESENFGQYRRWSSPAIINFVIARNNRLGGGSVGINVGGDETDVQKEHFGRNVQRILRGEERNYRLWGIAIDPNLESQDEGRTTVPFIFATVLAVLVVIGISLRSWRAVLLSALGLAMLIVWLKGISNLLGLKAGLVVELIVPIAMISLGVDFTIHALHRYGEERGKGLGPRPALRVGFAGVMGALVLAMLTDGVAFFSNTVSGIESIIGFGIAAGIAVVSSFIIMGVFVPLVFMRLDARRGAGQADAEPVSETGYSPDDSRPRSALSAEWVVARLARSRLFVLPVVAVVTGAALVFAVRLEAQLDVKDFFDSGSGFVVGLDKLDYHVGATQGEPGIIYIEGDLSSNDSLEALRELQTKLKANPYVAKGADGEPTLYSWTIFDLMERVVGSEYARSQVELVTKETITDSDGDGMPDTQAQIRVAFDYIVEYGIPLDESTLAFTPGQVQSSLSHGPTGHATDAIQILVGLPGTREQSVISRARHSVEADLEFLQDVPSISKAGLTGSAFTRAASLDAAVRSLLTSLPIAVAACFLVAALFMRSLRYAFVTIIPIGLVVAWLYAIMYLLGFDLNFVTATIGAVSIGVGVDFSIHFTQRFREELARAGDGLLAIERSARSTGMAVIASASSSVAGFAIMGFAPMPMFSAYGILTAVMVFMAAAAALLVLPSLLLLVTPERRQVAS